MRAPGASAFTFCGCITHCHKRSGSKHPLESYGFLGQESHRPAVKLSAGDWSHQRLDSGKIHFQASSGLWQNSVSCGCGTKVYFFAGCWGWGSQLPEVTHNSLPRTHSDHGIFFKASKGVSLTPVCLRQSLIQLNHRSDIPSPFPFSID